MGSRETALSTTMERDLSQLAAECELRLELHEPGYRVREIVPPATTLYDPMLGYVDDDGSLVFCDIGGQREQGWDPEQGHGAVWRLHPDDRIEAIVPPGNIGRGMIMFPMRAPEGFGEHGGELFFLGQLRPGRPGAHHTHAVYWVPPGSSWPEPFVIIPDAGTIGKGVAGALCPAYWGQPGTPDEGKFYVTSLLNCTLYEIDGNRRITPWLTCDEEHMDVPCMPRRVFRADEAWGDLAGELIAAGNPNTTFERPASAAPGIAYYTVTEKDGVRYGRRVDAPAGSADYMDVSNAAVAPAGFGPLAGKSFECTPGSVNLAHATKFDGGLPYDAGIEWTEQDGTVRTFASKLQSGAPHLMFQGDRMIVAIVRKSYSTGEYHLPDGSLYEITYAP